jgi:superfamily II DNA or RNA helicase
MSAASFCPSNQKRNALDSDAGTWITCRPGKDHCLIFDHSGTVNKLGYPDDIEYDYLPSSSDGMEEAPQRVVKLTSQKSCRKNAASAITSNLPEFISARNVVLNPGRGRR